MIRVTIPVGLALLAGVSGCATADRAGSGDAAEAGEVAFVSNRDGDHEIYVVSLTTGDTRQLTSNDALEFGLDWSPDGKRLAFGSDRDGNREIYVLELATGAVTRLTNHEARDSAPAWSRDGSRIAFTSTRDSARGEIYTMNADGSQVTRLTSNGRYEEAPAWSPDGRRLAFGALAAGPDGTEMLQVFVMDIQGGTERQLTSLPGHNSAPRWSPDGSRIAFYGNVGPGFVGADIFTIAPDGTDLVNLTNDDEPDWQPDWSPDGSQITFSRGPSDPLDLWIMDADGSNRRRIVEMPGRDEQPRWRPGPR